MNAYLAGPFVPEFIEPFNRTDFDATATFSGVIPNLGDNLLELVEHFLGVAPCNREQCRLPRS